LRRGPWIPNEVERCQLIRQQGCLVIDLTADEEYAHCISVVMCAFDISVKIWAAGREKGEVAVYCAVENMIVDHVANFGRKAKKG